MPWSANEATSHTKKASSGEQKKKWAKIANAALKTAKKKGKSQKEAEGYAIRVANSAMDEAYWSGDTFLDATWLADVDGKKLKQDSQDWEDFAEAAHTAVEVLPKQIIDSVQMNDAVELDDQANVRYLENGYMSAMPRIARSGIQLYKGDECGVDFQDVVRVYRPPAEVFKMDTAKSYTHLPVTSDHPGVPVNSSNWKKYAKGDTGDEVVRDGGFVRVPMMLKDQEVIQEYRNGKAQLSVGYTCDLEWSPGIVPDGELDAGKSYDCIQRDIRANHLAVVTAARGGPKLKIGDDNPDKGDDMTTLRAMQVDGIECQMTDTAAQVVQRHIQKLEQQLADARKKASEKEEEESERSADAKKIEDSLKAKDAQIATLQQQLKDAQDPHKLDAAVKERQGVIDRARQVLPTLRVDGQTVGDIRKQVVVNRLGDRANGWDDNQIAASFETLTDGVKASSGRDPIRGYADAFASPPRQRFDTRHQPGPASQMSDADRAQAEYDEDAANSWRGEDWQREKAHRRQQ